MAVDIIARGLGAGAAASAAEANRRLDNIGSGIAYKGAVDYYSDLPQSPTVGDAYTVKYQGSSGAEPDGTEYVWGDDGGTPAWIALGPDLSGYQEALTAGNGIDIGADNVIAATHDIFNITYGTTTKAAILDAIAAGRLPVMKYDERVYVAVKYSSSAITFLDSLSSNGYIVTGTKTYTYFSGATYVYRNQGRENEGETLRVDNEGNLSLTDWPAPEIIYNTTYADLVAAKSGGTLVGGAFYRITDYVTKINGTYDISSMAGSAAYVHYAKSAEHPFDIIVQALSNNELSENASAIQHAGDTYFANSSLTAWQLKYTVENNPLLYAWADTTNGKGVIYYMKDEFGNECHYDFKNIQYIAYAITYADAQYEDDLCYDASTQPNRYGSVYYVFQALSNYLQTGTYAPPFPDTWHKDFSVGANILGTIQFPTVDTTYLSAFNADWYYTFDEYNTSTGEHQDKTLNSSGLVLTYDNVIGRAPDALSVTLSLQNIPEGLPVNIFEYLTGMDEWCWANNFGDNSFLNVFGSVAQLKTGTQYSFSIFGHECYFISFGDGCKFNSFGNGCNSISFGDSCSANSFGNNCDSNSFGNNCNHNSFGNYCFGNSFSNNCSENSFGNGCSENSFGNNCFENSFGNNCQSNTVSERVYYIEMVNNTSPETAIGRYTILSGQYGPDSLNKYQLTISTSLVNQNYPMYVGLDTSGSVRIWNPATPFIAVAQGVSEAGKFLVVDNDGNVTPVLVAQWAGGGY